MLRSMLRRTVLQLRNMILRGRTVVLLGRRVGNMLGHLLGSMLRRSLLSLSSYSVRILGLARVSLRLALRVLSRRLLLGLSGLWPVGRVMSRWHVLLWLLVMLGWGIGMMRGLHGGLFGLALGRGLALFIPLVEVLHGPRGGDALG